jgi:hypothetical protein
MFKINFAEEIETHIYSSVTFSRKSCRLGDNVEKGAGDRETANDNMAPRACWISKVTRAQAHARAHTKKYVTVNAFPLQQWFPECASVLHCLSCLEAALSFLLQHF